MITTAPLPRPGHLWRALCGGGDTVAPWLRPGDQGFLTPRSAWSLAALAQAVAARRGQPARVLLPAWICNQSLWPLRQTGARLSFLPVDGHGAVDWTAAHGLDGVDMVMAVHAFGFPVPLDKARALADDHGALLIEDAAHCLMPAEGIHHLGDVVLYSPHKLLASPAGGILALRPRAADWAKPIAAALQDQNAGTAGSEWRWLARRMIQVILPDVLRPALPQGGQDRFETDPMTEALPPPLLPSPLARRLLGRARLEAEAVRRRANEAALRERLLGRTDLVPLFPAQTPAPYRMAMRAASPALAAEIYARLRAAHLPVESWPDLPPEVTADPRHAEGAVALRRSVLLLPVHGALTARALSEAYAEVLT